MSGESVTARGHTRRDRLIAMAAGAITVIAIVLGFAGDVLGLPWHWMRPAAELLLLAELVGLVVLERHQLFEPVHETVGATHSRVNVMQARMEEMHTIVMESVRNSGQVTACTSTPEVFRLTTRLLREALAREQQAPQILRIGRLAGRLARESSVEEDQDLVAEWHEFADANAAYFVNPGSAPDARARRWSVRVIFAFASVRNFDRVLEQFVRPLYAGRPSNIDLKILLRPRVEAMLSPALVTDRDVVMMFDDAAAASRWSIWFQGAQYRTLFERWFDDLWANIPDTYLIYSRNGFNQTAIDRIRNELEVMEPSQARETA